MKKTTINPNLTKAVTILRALTHPLRQSIIEHINSKTECKVGDINDKLKIDPAILSQHLKILRDSNMVTTRRDGKCIYYTVNMTEIERVSEIVNKI